MKIKIRWPPPAQPGEVNYSLFDRFTFVHFAIGSLYGVVGLSFVSALCLGVAWELVENPLKAYFPQVFPNATADTLSNSFGDTAAVCAGCIVAHYLFTTAF
jgi:hypothetical protein